MTVTQPLKVFSMDEVQVEEIKWLWYPYIPFGKITLIQGDGGCGKTFSILAIISALTTGGLLPESDEPLIPSNVIFQTAEDGLGDTIKTRLLQLEADCKRVLVIDDSIQSLSLSDVRIEQTITEHKAKLLVVDPWHHYLGANVDMYRANEVRPILKRIGDVAQRTGCAIIFIGHISKGGDGKSQNRALGSVDTVNASRTVLSFGKIQDENNPDLYGFAHDKANLAPKGSSIAYELSKDKGFNWIGAYNISSYDLFKPPSENSRPSTALDMAKRFIKDELTSSPILATVMYEKASNHGISERTLKEAKKALRAKSIKLDNDKRWYWSL